MGKYHKVTHEEHLTILASRHSVYPVPYAKISAKLGVSVRTVRRYANVQPTDVKLRQNRGSKFDIFKCEIEDLLNKDMGKQSHNIKTAMREFRAAHPDLIFGKTAFYDFVRYKCDLTREPKLARIPLEHDYGEAQIDFCEVRYYRNGRRVEGHLFTLTLPKSGMSFVQLFPAENQQCLFEGMKNIFEFMGFVPRVILFDNASTAVVSTRGKGKDAVPTKEYAEFSTWYGFEYKFCNPSSGWEKGAVEHANATKRKGYFTPPPHIQDEREYNKELLLRCLDDAKENHYLESVPKSELFEHEREAGIALPKKPFECSQTEVRKTNKCAIIQLKKCRYSVSDKHPQTLVLVKYDAFDVDIYEMSGEHICHHRRSYKAGATTINPTMYEEALAARPRARIKQSDNEYTNEILSELNKAITSVRPAAREDVMAEFCDQYNIACLPKLTKSKQAMLLYDLSPFVADSERYDQTLQSNSIMVQKTSAGRAVCRGRPK